MDQQEWMGYVSRLANGEYPVPVGMIQDYKGARFTGWAIPKAQCVF